MWYILLNRNGDSLRKYLIIVLITIVTVYGFNLEESKLYRLDNASRKNIEIIIDSGGDISRYFPNDYAEIYLNQYQYETLLKKGITIHRIIDRDKIYADSLYESTKNTKNPMSAYHTYQEITDTLTIWAQQFSNIAELHSIGQTVQGREMWIMKISDNVSFEEAEPEFKYISTMHGDEVVGKEMLIELIRLLLHEYGTTQRITDLVDNTEIWIMPNMNFDGTVANSRYNANGANLNRNFPDREYGDPPYPGHSYIIQPETQNMIDFTAQHNYVMSANFHGGALVANYPWDLKLPGDPGVYPYSACPDDITFIDLALTYAVNNPPMYNSSIFTNGITNGSAWYQIHGGMQDWNYFIYDCKEITMEISEIKWPPVSTLPQFWLENRESLLAYMEKVHTGIKGIILDSLTGLPIEAYVTILETGSGVSTDPDFGDYYKVISPGTYNVLVSAPDYRNTLVTNVYVDSFPATIIDIQLIPEITFELELFVEDIQTSNPIPDVKISLFKNGNIFLTDSTDLNGVIVVDVEPDSFELKLENELYFTIDTIVQVYSDTSFTFAMQQIVPAIVKGNISSTIGSSVAGAVIYCDGKIDSISSDGNFRLTDVKPGNISVFASLYDHLTTRMDTAVSNGDSLELAVLLESGNNEIFEDFESISQITYMETGDWERGIPSIGPMNAYSGVQLWATDLSNNYSNGSILSTLETGEIVVFGINNPVLKFYHWYVMENGTDGGNVKISIDNGDSWQLLVPSDAYPVPSLPAGGGNPLAGEPAFSGFQQYWYEATFDLINYSTYPVIKLRFDFGSDQTGNAEGWYIDDLQIYDGIVVKTEELNSSNSQMKPSINNYPNPFNPKTNIQMSLPHNSFVNLQVFDIKGALVKTITSDNYQSGNYTFRWDGTNESIHHVASGAYILRLNVNDYFTNRKLLLVR